MTEARPEVEGFDSTAYKVADEVEVAYVTVGDRAVRLGQGDPLPEGVHPDEVARLANGGVLADLEVVDVDGAELPELGNLAELKTRVGTDAELAQRYLDAENSREAPRSTWVNHLEGVVAAGGDEPPVVSADVEAGSVGIVEDEV